jgi:hypothetical protein
MNRIALVFIFSLSLECSQAQQGVSKLSVEISTGLSLPVGKFGDKAINDTTTAESSGWAKPGPALQIALNYQIKKSFGVSLLLGGQLNKQDNKSVAADQHRYLQGDSTLIVVSSKSWQIKKIMGGIYSPIPFSKSLFFQPRILVGILKTSIPGFSYTTYSLQNGGQMLSGRGQNLSLPLPWAFCFQLDADLHKQLSAKTYLTFGVSYSYAEPKWKYTIYPTPIATSGTGHTTKYPISSINAMVGLDYRF